MPETHHTRRRFVGITAALGAAAVAGCLHDEGEGPGEPDDDPGVDDDDADDGEDPEDDQANGADDDAEARVDDWLEDAENYENIEDMTGEDAVTVEVGAGDQGLSFEPPAIEIDAGTTVHWEWTGEGGVHDVSSSGDSDFEFDSGEPAEEDEFEHTFDEAGVGLYVCTPHENQGMKGAIVVVEE